MRRVLSDLSRNLVAGARLALGLRVSVLSFRVNLGSLVALLVVGVALDIAFGWVRLGTGARFTYFGLQDASVTTGVFLFVTAIVALALKQPHLMLTVPVLAFAASPMLQIAGLAYRLTIEQPARYETATAWIVWIVLTAWYLFVTARVFFLALAPRQPHFWIRTVASVVLVAGSGIGAQMLFGERGWWYSPERSARNYDYFAVVSEQALAKQPGLLSAALAGLEAQRPGVVDLYFVGFAPYAVQDVFRKDVELAERVIAERFDGAGRSVTLVNHPRSVLEKPLATVTNLRATLKAVGRRIDRDEDIVLVLLTSHGGKDHTLATYFPPLRLESLTPGEFKAMLDEAGIRWRIIVVSACYSGGFVPALRNDETIVLTAAAADRQSFGCADDSELTYFTDAMFNQALRHEWSIPGAFAKARTLIADRERAEGLAPASDPQIAIGAAIASKLPELEDRLRAKASAACAPGTC